MTLLLSGETRSETVGAASGKKEQSWESVPVNSAKFIEGGEEAVPEHERYLYRYRVCHRLASLISDAAHVDACKISVAFALSELLALKLKGQCLLFVLRTF